MLLVKRNEISLREFIVRLKGEQKKQLRYRMKEKACQQMSFTDWFWKVWSPNGLSVLLTRRKKGKTMLPVCLLSAVWPSLSTARSLKKNQSTDPQRFLVEDFFLLVIKPPGTYFNNEFSAFLQIFEVQLSFPRYQRFSQKLESPPCLWAYSKYKISKKKTKHY